MQPASRDLNLESRDAKSSMDFRIPDIDRQLSAVTAQSRLRFWLRGRRPLAPGSRAQQAVFAYISDSWLNFSSFDGHVRDLQLMEPPYLSNLNHYIGFIVPSRPTGLDAYRNRKLLRRTVWTVDRTRSRRARVIATSIQETLMVHPAVS